MTFHSNEAIITTMKVFFGSIRGEEFDEGGCCFVVVVVSTETEVAVPAEVEVAVPAEVVVAGGTAYGDSELV